MIPGCVAACPGCRHREFSAAESHARKEAWVRSCLSSFPVSPILAPAARWGYRRKATLHARYLGDRWGFGLLKRTGREEEFISIPDCPLHDPWINQILAVIGAVVSGESPLVYAGVAGRALTLVFKEKRAETRLASLRVNEGSLRTAGVEALWVNWNPAAGRRVLSSRHMERVFGKEWLLDGGVLHGPTGFRQQIPELEDKAQTLAEEFLADGASRFVVDLYSGLGLTLRRWQKRRWRAVGVELGGESAAAAAKNAPGAECFRGRVEERLPQLEGLSGFTLYTNPPRSGHAPEVNEWILRRLPERVAYLSCNAKSLARDIEALSGAYDVVRVQPFDFFPQTDHVESLALLRKMNTLAGKSRMLS